MIKEEQIPERLNHSSLPIGPKESMIKEVLSPALPREIGKIGVKISSFMQAYCGIEFIDRDGQSMFKWEQGFGRWEYQEIPKHKTVVGLHGCAQINQKEQNYIQRLGVVVLRQ